MDNPRRNEYIAEQPGDLEEQAWLAARGALQTVLPRGRFETWAASASYSHTDNGRMVIATENQLAADWLNENAGTEALHVIQQQLPEVVELHFTPSPGQNGSQSNGHRPVSFDELPEIFAAVLIALEEHVSLTQARQVLPHLHLLEHSQEARSIVVGIAQDKDTLLWATENLHAPLQQLLSQALGCPVTVRLKLDDGWDAPYIDVDSMRVRYYGPLKQLFYRHDLGHVYPAYLQRFIPLIGTDLFWTLIGFRQAYYQKTLRAPGPQDELEVSLAAVAQLLGRDKNTVLRHRDNQHMAWFLEHVPRSSFYRDKEGGLKSRPHGYVFKGIPITPMDQDTLKSWLLKAGIQEHPEQALKEALLLDPKKLLGAEAPVPNSQQKRRNPERQPGFERFILDLCPPMAEENTANVLALAEALYTHLLDGFGNTFVSLYFLKHWLPELGSTAAAFLQLCRQRTYVNERHGEYREWFRAPDGKRTLLAFAPALGISQKSLDRCLPSFAAPGQKKRGRRRSSRAKMSDTQRQQAERRDRLQKDVSRFLQKANQDAGGGWQIAVRQRDPLREHHQAEYEQAMLLVAQFLLETDHDFSESDVNAFISRLTQAGLFDNSHDAYTSNSHDTYAMDAHDAYTNNSHDTDAGIPHDADTPKTHDTYIGKSSSSIRGLTTFRSLQALSLRNYLLKLRSTTNNAPRERHSQININWTAGVGGRWKLNRLLESCNLSSAAKQEFTAEQASASAIAALLLYAFSKQGQGIRQPLEWLHVQLKRNGYHKSGLSTRYERLALQGPQNIQALLKGTKLENGYVHVATELPGAYDWIKVMAGTMDDTQLLELGELLGLCSLEY